MKKYLFGTAVTAGVLFAGPQAADAAIDDHGSLSYGDSNSSVNDLQEALKEEGHFEGYTGSRFGPKTLEAVKDFQSAEGLSSPSGSYYGVAGPSTQSSLMDAIDSSSSSNTASSSSKSSSSDSTSIGSHGSLSYGDSNSSVNALQKELKEHGFFEGYTGSRFGPKTLQAVKDFQSATGLSSPSGSYYGVAGPSTQSALMDYDGSSASSDEVKSSSDSDSDEQVAGVSTGTGADIVSTAKQYMGTPYVWGGMSPSGFDCSGFLNYVYDKHGKSMPRTVASIYSESTKVSSPSVGDIVFFDTRGGASHAGIYVGNNEFIHAGASTGVTVSSMDSSYWAPRYMGAGQI
ncbi:Putative peptidoglycan binding domain-containing protein [Marinococcus luteus]|uniref:Putative peptidoglycan binding domain-containing protein n=1 Tax=Marinococcus luteus TaxID=1122204 RepID=A0A1H2UR32_9BACI|nr:NlpC/P60 family protein [Marinococcus luteus]SDW58606.1 Putative peptidoglycan binding domain-containing protein [Marinococcus luteus]